jgi:hypothetical protein
VQGELEQTAVALHANASPVVSTGTSAWIFSPRKLRENQRATHRHGPG